jgi:phosphoribosylanthranilate isomerase
MDAAVAVVAANAGADAIGFVFAPSRRRVTVEQARAIAAQLPPFVTKVGVFVDEDPDRVRDIANAVRLDAVQLHGGETPEYAAALELPVIKAVRVRDAASLDGMRTYRVAAFLLDSFEPDVAGGTGKPFDWALGAGLAAPAPVVLAGGLTAENVREAIDIVRPFGVDVSSGVETGGRKDPGKIREFIARVRDGGGRG